jgi:MYXO-CTERM domain-containing protein
MDSGSGTMDNSAAIDVGALAQLDSGAVDAVPVMADASPDIVPVINTGTDATVEGGSIQGGGCSCNTLGTQSSRPGFGWLMLFGVVLGVGLRSRKRSR